jgi:hypothetical protein
MYDFNATKIEPISSYQDRKRYLNGKIEVEGCFNGKIVWYQKRIFSPYA